TMLGRWAVHCVWHAQRAIAAARCSLVFQGSPESDRDDLPQDRYFREEGAERVIKLRLRRMGAKKRPSYRIVAADSRSPRDGRFIEIVGTYDPITDPATITLKADRIQHWLSVGAQPSDTVRDIIKRAGAQVTAAADETAAAEAPATA